MATNNSSIPLLKLNNAKLGLPQQSEKGRTYIPILGNSNIIAIEINGEVKRARLYSGKRPSTIIDQNGNEHTVWNQQLSLEIIDEEPAKEPTHTGPQYQNAVDSNGRTYTTKGKGKGKAAAVETAKTETAGPDAEDMKLLKLLKLAKAQGLL